MEGKAPYSLPADKAKAVVQEIIVQKVQMGIIMRLAIQANAQKNHLPAHSNHYISHPKPLSQPSYIALPVGVDSRLSSSTCGTSESRILDPLGVMTDIGEMSPCRTDAYPLP